MRLLFLSPYSPYPPCSGGSLRIYHLLTSLAQRHDVSLITFVPPHPSSDLLDPLRDLCHRIETVPEVEPRPLAQRAWTTLTSPLPDMAFRNESSAYKARLTQLLQEESFDAIFAESIEMAGYALQAADMLSGSCPLLLLDEFNAEYILQQRAAQTDFLAWRQTPFPEKVVRLPQLVGALYSFIQAYKLRRYEQNLLTAFDHIIAVSRDDRRALHRLVPNACITVVPNGVDTTTFAPPYAFQYPSSKPHPPTFVFTGSLSFRPNIDAVTWFSNKILPLIRIQHPTARFIIVGRNPTSAVLSLQQEGVVEVVANVADVRPFMSAADVYVIPMRIGGGIRLKLLEALAMEAPIVSTTVGAEGVEGLTNGTHVLLADTPDTFAKSVLSLLEMPAKGKSLGAAGRKLVIERYDWGVVVPRIEPLLKEKTGLLSEAGQHDQ